MIRSGVLSQTTEFVFYTTFSVGTTAGVVVYEGAPYDDYAGTWSNLATVTWATADTTHRTNVTGLHMALRARVTTTIVGGTVTTDFLAASPGR